MSLLPYLTAALFLLTTSITLRLLYILPSTNPTSPHPRPRSSPVRILIVLGSGGHTAEMLSLLSTSLNPSYHTHRTYVISSGDDFSALKAIEFERAMERKYATATGFTNSISISSPNIGAQRGYDIRCVPRARRIHQSLLTTPISACWCLCACFGVLRGFGRRHPQLDSLSSSSLLSAANWTKGENGGAKEERYKYPDLIMANGPGTAVLVILASLILHFFACKGTHGKMRSIYIESWARVKKLSLSGRILRTAGMVNRFMVQWEGLAQKGAEFRGALVH